MALDVLQPIASAARRCGNIALMAFGRGVSGNPAHTARLWWLYLVGAGAFLGLAAIFTLLGADGAGLAAVGPAALMGFLGGFSYSERLRVLGKTRGRFGPERSEL